MHIMVCGARCFFGALDKRLLGREQLIAGLFKAAFQFFARCLIALSGILHLVAQHLLGVTHNVTQFLANPLLALFHLIDH